MKTTDNQKELFIVVDEKDQIMGYKSRYECHHNSELIHRAINIALINDKDEIAFQKRSMTKDLYPGYYALTVTGHVSKGENYITAAIREMKEEVGVTGINLKHMSTQVVNEPAEREMVAFYTGIYNGSFKALKEEVDNMYYFSKENIYQIINNITPCSFNSLKILGWI